MRKYYSLEALIVINLFRFYDYLQKQQINRAVV